MIMRSANIVFAVVLLLAVGCSDDSTDPVIPGGPGTGQPADAGNGGTGGTDAGTTPTDTGTTPTDTGTTPTDSGGTDQTVSDILSTMTQPCYDICLLGSGCNEPDFEDSLRSLLMAHAGLSFVETVVQFSAWRWAPPSPFDGHSIPLAADVPAKQTTVVLDPAPMLLGSVYVRVKGAPGESISVGVDGDSAVAWAVRTTGADSVDPTLSAVTLDDTGELVLAVTALPLVPEGDDPDDRSDDRYGVSLLLGYSGGE